MALEQADLEQIERIIKNTMQASMADHPVKCPIPSEWATSLGHFSGMVQDVGKGDMRQGVENIRIYFKAIDGFLNTRDRMREWIAKTVVVTIAASFLAMIALGIKAWFEK
jgi:hypothetical protein